MRKRVKLADVTAGNWEAVVDLELDEAQEDLVASNAYSLAESKFDGHARPRAVYAGKRVVGFLMYEIRKARGPLPEGDERCGKPNSENSINLRSSARCWLSAVRVASS